MVISWILSLFTFLFFLSLVLLILFLFIFTLIIPACNEQQKHSYGFEWKIGHKVCLSFHIPLYWTVCQMDLSAIISRWSVCVDRGHGHIWMSSHAPFVLTKGRASEKFRLASIIFLNCLHYKQPLVWLNHVAKQSSWSVSLCLVQMPETKILYVWWKWSSAANYIAFVSQLMNKD